MLTLTVDIDHVVHHFEVLRDVTYINPLTKCLDVSVSFAAIAMTVVK